MKLYLENRAFPDGYEDIQNRMERIQKILDSLQAQYDGIQETKGLVPVLIPGGVRYIQPQEPAQVRRNRLSERMEKIKTGAIKHIDRRLAIADAKEEDKFLIQSKVLEQLYPNDLLKMTKEGKDEVNEESKAIDRSQQLAIAYFVDYTAQSNQPITEPDNTVYYPADWNSTVVIAAEFGMNRDDFVPVVGAEEGDLERE